MNFIRYIYSLAAAGCLLFSKAVIAWDGVATGTIAGVHMVGGAGGAPGNHDFRVYLSGYPAMCAGAVDASWAYINANDPNYKGIVSLIMYAHAQGKSVTIYSVKGPTGFCNIGYVQM